jgi:hypothetical protein
MVLGFPFNPAFFHKPGKRKIELPRVLTRGAMDTTKNRL